MPDGYWIGLIVFAVATAAILLARWWLVRGAKPGEEACGHCGYLVYGLPSSICPECGHDINIVGTRRPSRWLGLRPITRLMICLFIWTGWCGAASALVWRPFWMYVQPHSMTYMDGYATQWVLDGGSPSNRDQVSYHRLWTWEQSGGVYTTPVKIPADAKLVGLRIDALENHGFRPMPSDGFFYDDKSPESEWRCFWVDFRDNTIHYEGISDGSSVTTTGDWATILDRWLQDIETHLLAPGLLPLVNALMAKAGGTPQILLNADHMAQMRSSIWGWSMTPTPDSRYTYGALSTAILCWLAIVVLLIRRHRRLTAMPAK